MKKNKTSEDTIVTVQLIKNMTYGDLKKKLIWLN